MKNLNIRVITDFDPDLPPLMAVGSQLKQVFMNMITNANTAMPSGGDLTVASRYDTDGDKILVSVGDTGVGIPPKNLDRIFEAFFTTKKEVKGVGLGLSICYELIKNHSGRIDVQIEVDKGTISTIHLPLHPENDPMEESFPC